MTIKKEKIFSTILGCIVSEKSNMLSEKNKTIVLTVSKNSTKREIKKSVEEVFNIKVESVNTLISKGKSKRFRSTLGKRNDFKKAYITLEDGQNLSAISGSENSGS